MTEKSRDEEMAEILARLARVDRDGPEFNDPARTVYPAAKLHAVADAMAALCPAGYGGSYETQGGIIHVGLTRHAPADIERQLLAQVREVSVVTFSVKYAWSELSALQDAVTQDAIDDTASPIVTISIDPRTNTVKVGMPDVTDPAGGALKRKYGDALQIVQQNRYHAPGGHT